MVNENEYEKTLSAANGLIDRLKKENAALKELCELQDKLLICYRIGKNPGSILDKLSVARDKVSEF